MLVAALDMLGDLCTGDAALLESASLHGILPPVLELTRPQVTIDVRLQARARFRLPCHATPRGCASLGWACPAPGLCGMRLPCSPQGGS